MKIYTDSKNKRQTYNKKKTMCDVLRSKIGSTGEFNVVIEIPKDGGVKYELDKTGILLVDRLLPSSVKYPTNYGFVPQTLCGDGDAIDVIVLLDVALDTGCVIRCRPVGMMRMEDESGKDPKLVAVPVHDVSPRYDRVKDISDVDAHELLHIRHFFANYKTLDSTKWVKIDDEWGNSEEAWKEFRASVDLYERVCPTRCSSECEPSSE